MHTLKDLIDNPKLLDNLRERMRQKTHFRASDLDVPGVFDTIDGRSDDEIFEAIGELIELYPIGGGGIRRS